jgi:hypothetical protein
LQVADAGSIRGHNTFLIDFQYIRCDVVVARTDRNLVAVGRVSFSRRSAAEIPARSPGLAASGLSSRALADGALYRSLQKGVAERIGQIIFQIQGGRLSAANTSSLRLRPRRR